MLAKPAFILRSLLVASCLASLVACSFDGQPTEEEKGSSSALHNNHDRSDASAPSKGHKGADGGVDDNDASVDLDGGAGWGTDASADAGPHDNGTDASAGWGDDDDDNWGTDAGAGWGTDAG